MSEDKKNISSFLFVLLLVFAAEIAVMLALPVLFPPMHWLSEALLDAFLLTSLVSYPLYLLIIKPLRTIALEERQKAETAAFEKHEAFHSIFHASPLAVIAVDRDRKVITWNPAAERIFGWKAVEVLGQQFPSIPEDNREEFLELHQMTLMGKTVENLELNRRTKSGAVISVSLSTAPLRDMEGNIYGAMAIMADITARKRTEERIQRLHRTLAMMSATNKATVRFRDRQELAAEICRIAVKQGGFRMAWLGEIDAKSLTVKKTCCDGVEDGYLDGIRIAVLAGSEGNGPTGEAIRYGQAVICNDIEHDPLMAPWREAALTRGYRSSASFPLRVEKSVVGAINFYSGEPEFFDDDEVRLLEEMAGDVSFALEFIEQEIRRREAEQLVYLAKQDWEDTFNAITEMVTIHDADFNIIRANKAAEKILGLPMLNVKKAKCFQHYHGMECPPAGCPSCECLKTGKPAVFEVFEPHLNMYLELMAIPRLDGDNNIAGLIHVARDISERKKFEDTLRDQKLFAESLVQNSAVATFVLNADHKVLLWNKACEELTGVPAAEVIGTDNHWKPFYDHRRPTIADIIIEGSPEKMPDLYATFAQSALVPSGLQAEGWYEDLNGRDRYILFDAAPIRDSEGRLIVAIETLHDITPLKRIEEKLQETEHRYKAMIEAEPECVTLLSLDGTILETNPAGLKLLEADAPGQVVSKLIAPFVSPEHRAAFQSYCGDVIRDGAATLEFELTGMRGARHSVQSVSVPLRDLQGAVTAILSVTRDITEQKKLEAQLRHVQKMEAIGTLAGGISHDFNNILTAIIGYASILKMKLAAGDPLHSFLDQILASTERAANLTQGLLAFSRKLVISPRPVSANEIIKRVESLLRRLIGEDIELAVSLAGEDVAIIADSGQIEQVLMNLAMNARDAMPGGGRLTILTERLELTKTFVKAHGYGKEGKYVVITVSDTGTGMDPRTINRIFEPFFTTKEVGRGTGLGLSLAYGIVKQHNGFINCVSEPGKVTTFRIYLPQTVAAIAAQTPRAAPPAFKGGTETVLLAEDDYAVRNLTASVLRNFGYRVIEAVDGQDAVEKFREHRDAVELLLFDVMMPKMNGQEAYEQIGKLKPGVRALFTSGYTPEAVLNKGVLLEGANFVMKPLSPEALLKKVREVLDK